VTPFCNSSSFDAHGCCTENVIFAFQAVAYRTPSLIDVVIRADQEGVAAALTQPVPSA